ncbi:MAG: SufS family cysteine desulfurase [Fuerstiella sp.]
MFITLDEIFEEFEDLDPRDQSQYLLELGYDLPRFAPEQQRDCDLVHGCQSQVWLTAEAADGDDPEISFSADSDAEIVRGLITILLAAYDGRKASEILAFPVTSVFDRLRLKQYISPQRHNGLQGMVDRIRQIAASHAPASTPQTQTLPLEVAARDGRGASASGHNASGHNASARASGTHSTLGDGNGRSPAVRMAEQDSEARNSAFDPEAIRRQFPVLNQTLDDGLRPVFLDSAASAQKPQVVIDKEREVEEQYFANAYRGRYSFGARVDEELEASRERIAGFIGAASSRQIAFTPGTTATINMVAAGWGDKFVGPGDEVLITEMEHHANFVPWQQLALRKGATLKFIPLTPDGRLDLSRLDEVLTDRTKVLAVGGMSNVLGTVHPVAELTRRAHEVGAIIVVDGAQSVPHMTTDVTADDIDFLIFSGHKLYGPTGVGILYGRPDRLDEMDPILFGGHMIDRVYRDHSTWAAPPAKFEAGTPPIVQAIALGTAVKWIQDIGIEAIHRHEQQLLQTATEQLQQVAGMTIYGPDTSHKGAIVSFRMDRVHPEDLAALLDRKAVFTRHGHHCAMPLHDLLGVSATTRASFAAYNTAEDVAALTDAIQFARDVLKVV